MGAREAMRSFDVELRHRGILRSISEGEVMAMMKKLTWLALVEQCAAPNRTHGPPLAFSSCNPPVETSDHVDGRNAGRRRSAPQLDGLLEAEG